MTYELIITEKPSAAMKMAYSLADSKPIRKSNGAPYYMLSHNKKDIVIVSAVGHLFGVSEKKKETGYPIFDIDWKPTYMINNKAMYSQKYALNIKKLAQDANSFTVACDYDIEGEVIGLNCVQFLCNQKDANRMKFSTLTKPDLINAYENKANTINWGQAHAGVTRHFLDWLYGINISRALTSAIRKKGGNKTLSSGRVQGPALKLIVDREKEISDFKPTPYWQLELNGSINNSDISAFHEKDKFLKEAEVEEILKKTTGKDGVVKNVEKNEKILIPPYAFDLTTLQMEAYRTLKISPKQSLAIAQKLYLAGVISYPRTSSQKLPPTIGYKKILSALQKNDDYKKLCSKILSGEKIYPRQGMKDDPAHPAIFPTGNQSKNPKPEEKKIYDLIVRRFLSAFGESVKQMETILSIDIQKEIFIAKGLQTIEKGWHEFYGKYSRKDEKELPVVKENDVVTTKEIIKHTKETTPPRRFSPASVIKELEKRNLGTKSTRAQIIDTLYQRNFIKGNQIEATIMGIRIVDTLKHYIPEIVDEELTRQFEDEMQEIRDEKNTKEKVLQEAKDVLTKLLNNFKKQENEIGSELVSAQKETIKEETLGKCPTCKEGELLIKRGKFGRFIACNNYPDCKTIYNIPNQGFIQATGNKCPACKTPTVFVQFKGRKKQEMCINSTCSSKETVVEEEERECPKCKKGTLKLRTSMYGKFYGCSNYPKCRYTEKVKKTKEVEKK